MDRYRYATVARLRKYITFADLDNMKDEDEVLLCRVDLFDKISRLQLAGSKEKEKLAILDSAYKRLHEKDFGGEYYRCSFGVEMTVKDIKTVFTAEDFEGRRTGLRLIDNYEKLDDNGASV